MQWTRHALYFFATPNLLIDIDLDTFRWLGTGHIRSSTPYLEEVS